MIDREVKMVSINIEAGRGHRTIMTMATVFMREGKQAV